MTLERDVRDNLLKARIRPKGARLLVGVSGGADSMALLTALVLLRQEYAWEIVVAHYDHALRKGSVRDRVFVEKYARRLGLRSVSGVRKGTLPSKGSIEDFARQKRYAFFLSQMRKTGADALVLAHTRDDLAETVLMRILRGTGLAGLRGMALRYDGWGYPLLRPLLTVSRERIEGFLRAQKVGHREDPTNRSMDFFRNRVRRDLIPFLEKGYATGIKDRLCDLAETSGEDHAFIRAEAARAVSRVTRRVPRGILVRGRLFSGLPSALRREMVRCVLEGVRGDLKAVTLGQVRSLEESLMGQEVRGLVLPARIGIERKGADSLLFNSADRL